MEHKIAILGDFNTGYTTHHALNKAVQEVQALLPGAVQFHWIGTDAFDPIQVFEHEAYKGLWIAPGSPYKNDGKVLEAITYVRTHHIPTLGNCGGFQYMLIEFARNVCGITQAAHEETDAGAQELLISKLSCSLVEQEEELDIVTGSLLHNIIRKEKITGRYYCSYGLNNAYHTIVQQHGLTFTAFSADKQVRAFELATHPFFLGTLFQPALTSTADEPNPIIMSFVQHCIHTHNTIISSI